MLNRVEEIDHTDLDNHDRLRAVMQKEGIKQNKFGGRMHYQGKSMKNGVNSIS